MGGGAFIRMFKEVRTPLYLAVIASCLLVVVLNTPLKSSLFDMRDVFSLAQEPPPHKEISGVTGSVFKGDRIRMFDQPLRFRHEERPLPDNKSSLTFGANLKHDKWAVCTTIHTVTQVIIDIAKDPEWAIVIVGDEGMEPLEVKGDKAFVLDAETQRALAKDFPALFGMLPWKHFGRKNIGYLFAILHGADMVWDFDDDNFIKEGKKAVSVDASTLHEVVPLSDDCIAFNPLPLMGGDDSPTPMWPRGFPLNLIRRPCDYTLVNHGQPDSIAVFQSLADNEPDVDGIYRLTRVTPMDFQADPTQKTLVIPPGILSPFNAQATLVMKGGLWSLLLPVSVHGRVSDIWRSYIAQRLFWDIGYKLAFTPPVVDQYRNPHDPLADMQAESDLYSKSLALVKYLHRWKGTASTLPGRHEELLVNLYERDYLGKEDVLLAQEWLAALEEIGFNFPSLVGEGYIPPFDTIRYLK